MSLEKNRASYSSAKVQVSLLLLVILDNLRGWSVGCRVLLRLSEGKELNSKGRANVIFFLMIKFV